MGIGGPRLCQPPGQKPQRHPAPVIIHGGQQKDIGIQRHGHPGDGGDLRRPAIGQILDQQPRPLAVQRDVPGGKAQCLGREDRRKQRQKKGGAEDQNSSSSSSAGRARAASSASFRSRLVRIMSAIRAMATPRISRLAGR